LLKLKNRKLDKYIYIFKKGYIFRFDTNQIIKLETIPNSDYECKLCKHIHSKQDWVNKLNETKKDRIDILCKCNFTFVIVRNGYKYSDNDEIKKYLTYEILNNDRYNFDVDYVKKFDDNFIESEDTDPDDYSEEEL